ncbi:MAG: response regulator [Bdellovibrionales bacterium]|nr:response regulator [Bdellovibrionales bacterium]
MFPKETKIAVVDDMSTMRKLVAKHLQQLGYENVQAFDDGAVAWPEIEKAHASGEPFQLIISDWNMPRTNGLELLSKVRSTKEFSHLPFIMLTAESENHQVDKANLLKVSGYIKKPFTPATLAETLDLVFKKNKKAA